MNTLDFSKADYTAVVSDLHLCEAEPLHPLFPLWKKYKTRQFFFDNAFFEFLRHLDDRSQGAPIELVLNGDIFDFDSILVPPQEPTFRISWLEKIRGLHAEEGKSVYKIQKILNDHKDWVLALRWFIAKGHRAVFVMGNHDLELHWPQVQKEIIKALRLGAQEIQRVRFVEMFYISNKDTLIEHGNQYDPYCVCPDPLNPYLLRYNTIEVRLPFGNLACRYMINGMGFFNPHVDSAYIMSISEYIKFFVKYMIRAQPLLVWTWFWGAFVTLWQSLVDALQPPLRDPMSLEERVEAVATKANATPRMVREMKELIVSPATRSPYIILRELWLDRALLVLLMLLLLGEGFLFIKQMFDVSIFWMFIPIVLFLPFFLFYSRGVSSNTLKYKEPQDNIMSLASRITKTKRIIYGHTHIIRHEMIGAIEHLNPGSWSPAFLDVECTKPIANKAFIWIQPSVKGEREARIFHFEGRAATDIFKSRAAQRA